MDASTEKILERARQRREALDQELQKTPSISPSSSVSRKRRPLEETANVAAESADSQPKRQSLGNEATDADKSLYPVEELKRLSEKIDEIPKPEAKSPDENPLPAKLATPASGLGDGDFQRSKSVTSSTRKARFAALAAEIDHFEIDSSHSVVIPPRYVSPKGSPVAIRKAQQADTASRSSPKMSPQATRKWSESEVKVSSPKPAEKKSVEIAVPVTSPAEKKAKIGEEDCGIETFAVPKGRDPLESVSSVDSDMVVVYNEKSSSDSDRSASPVKEQKKTEMTCLITSNLRVDRSPASVTPKKVLFSDETTMLEPTSQLHQLEANVTPKAAIASINAQSGGGDSTKVGKLASQWEQKIKSSGQKTPVVVSKSPQSIGKLVKQAVTPVENLPFGDKLKKFDSAKKPEATTHRFQTPKLSDMTKCEKSVESKPMAKPVIRPVSTSATTNLTVVKATVTPTPVIHCSTESLSEEEKRQEIQKLRNRWELASATGQLLQPGKKLEENHDEITSVALRVFAPRSPRPLSVPNMDRMVDKSELSGRSEKAKSTMNIVEAVEVQQEDEIIAAPVSAKNSEDSDDSVSQRASTETESSCVSTETDDFELESYLNEAMSKVDHMDFKIPSDPVEEKPVEMNPAPQPLVHTISFYRNMTKAQNTPTHNKPVRVETPKQLSPTKAGAKPTSYRAENYKEKMRLLNEEVNRQQNVISQASRALNVCKSSDEFRGSTEEVEAEKLLLIATQKRMGCLSEIERLGKLMINGAQPELGPFGTLNISDISVPLKREFINSNINGSEDEMIYYFICLIKHREQVIFSEMVSSHQAVLKQQLDFCNYVQLSPLTADFVVTFEIYQLVTRRENLTHAEKYRINTLSKGKKASTAPSSAHSIATPGGIRTTNFDLAGTVTINLQSLKSNKFALQGVKFNSPIETWVYLKLRCLSECSAVQEKGFLNWYEEVSGVGAWQRRWCSLEDNQIKCWRYPDEEMSKEPLSLVDLTMCANNDVSPVAKEVCARSHTFMLLLPLRSESKQFVAKSLLVAADTKEEFLTWCQALNEVFRSVRLWNPSPISPSKFSTLV